MKQFIQTSLFLAFFIICSVAMNAQSTDLSDHQNPELCLIFDNQVWLWPKKFRTTKDHSNQEVIEFDGLTNTLASGSASGSGQFSEEGLRRMMTALPASQIVILDLRQESHGFINGKPVSWRKEPYNDANIAKSVVEIEKDEIKRLKRAYEGGSLCVQTDTNTQDVIVYTAQTERELVESLGSTYIRIPVTDHYPPSDEAVDKFMNLIFSLPDDVWVHFHCKGGSGRTTTFMAMYDMMLNANKVNLECILKRQKALGGKDLLEFNEDPYKYQAGIERLEFVKAFYEYCRQEPEFKLTWSKWRAQNQPDAFWAHSTR